MEISAKELIENDVEVDLPVEWDKTPTRQRTIKYDKETQMFVMADIRTKEIIFSYNQLSDLVRNTNNRYNMDDIAVE